MEIYPNIHFSLTQKKLFFNIFSYQIKPTQYVVPFRNHWKLICKMIIMFKLLCFLFMFSFIRALPLIFRISLVRNRILWYLVVMQRLISHLHLKQGSISFSSSCISAVFLTWHFLLYLSNCYPGSLDIEKTAGKIVVCVDTDPSVSRKVKKLVAEDSKAKGLIVIDETEKGVPFDSGSFPFSEVGNKVGVQILDYINSTK